MTSSQRTKDFIDRLTLWVGGLFLVALVLGSWIPTGCPYVRKWLLGCPVPLSMPPTPAQQELNRIGHEDLRSSQYFFTVPLEQGMTTVDKARVRFYYRLDGDDRQATLQLKTSEGFVPVALISHPLLANLQWPAVRSETIQLFQRNGGPYTSVDGLTANPPPTDQLLADAAAVRQLHLLPGHYTPLESATVIPDSVNYILTTMPLETTDGSWKIFDTTILTNDVAVSSDLHIEWSIAISPSPSEAAPARLGVVHIDYHRVQ